MPDLSRYLIKTSLAYLVAALLVGISLTAPVIDFVPQAAAVYPSYIHLFVLGWLTQLIFGVAYWLFPRASKERPYGNAVVAVVGFVLLNAGLLMRLVSEPAFLINAADGWRAVLVASAVLQWLGVSLFAVYFWSRVKGK